jgi:hypothetical protein
MADYYFERECRTYSSEAYNILEGGSQIGHLDIHFTTSVVHATLCVEESLTREMIEDMIETLDEEILDVVGVTREEFIIHVHQGRHVGIYSNHTFEQDEEAG